MKTYIFVLLSFISAVSRLTMAEIAESNSIQNFLNRASSENRVIWGGEMEYKAVPDLLQNFFHDSDCTFDHGTPGGAILPFMQDKYKVNASQLGGQLVCQSRYGQQSGGKSFTLCTHASVSCKSPIGGLKKDSIVYMVPDGKSCDSISAREAMLNSMQSNYGDFNATAAQ